MSTLPINYEPRRDFEAQGALQFVEPGLPSLGMFMPPKELAAGKPERQRRLEDAGRPDLVGALGSMDANLSVGSPVIPPHYFASEARKTVGHLPHEASPLSSPWERISDVITRSVIPNAGDYSPPGGGPKHKEIALKQVGVDANPLTIKEATLVTGGVPGAMELIDRYINLANVSNDAEIENLTITDSRDLTEWIGVLDIIAAAPSLNRLVHLVVTDAAQMPADAKVGLAHAMQSGTVKLTDIFTQTPQSAADGALPLDDETFNEVRGSILEVESSGLEATGITLVRGEKATHIEAYQLGWRGTPASTGLDIRAFLDGNTQEFLQLDDVEIEQMTAKRPVVGQTAYFLKQVVLYKQAIQGGNKTHAEEIMDTIKARHELIAIDTETKYKALHDESLGFFDDVEVIETDGAARGGLHLAAAVSGAKHYVTPKECWPTDMTVPDDVNVIVLMGCYDSDGNFLPDKYLEQVRERQAEFGEDKVAFDLKTIGNPQGTMHSTQTIDKILEFMQANPNFVGIEDWMYGVYGAKEGVPVNSYLKRATDRGDMVDVADRLIMIDSASKNYKLAGARSVMLMTTNKDWTDKFRHDRQSRVPNWESTLLFNQKLSDPKRYWFDAAVTNIDTQNRLTITNDMLSSGDISSRTPDWGYYPTDVKFSFIGGLPEDTHVAAHVRDDMLRLYAKGFEADMSEDAKTELYATEIEHRQEEVLSFYAARRYGVAVNAIESFMGGVERNDRDINKGARLSAGGSKARLVNTGEPDPMKAACDELDGLFNQFQASQSDIPDLVKLREFANKHYDYTPFKKQVALSVLLHQWWKLGTVDAVMKTDVGQKLVAEGIIKPADIEVMQLTWDVQPAPLAA